MSPSDGKPASFYIAQHSIYRKLDSPCQDSPLVTRRILLVDNDESHARRHLEDLAGRGLHVDLFSTMQAAISRLRMCACAYEVVVVNVSDPAQPWLRRLEMLQEAAFQSAAPVGPFLLCVSNVKRDLLFKLQIQLMGGELVYEE
jgi:hypothetical protein